MTLYCETFTQQIEESLNVLNLALRLQIGFREKYISNSCFTPKIGINYATGSYLKPDTTSNNQLKDRFQNLVFSAMGTASCAIDRALDDKFGRENKNTSDIRSIFYTIRCAFAHDPINPKWQCHEKYCKTYRITINKNESSHVAFQNDLPESMKFELNFQALNKQSLKFEHFLALDGFFLLAEYAKKIII